MDIQIDSTERERRFDFYRVTSISMIFVFTAFIGYHLSEAAYDSVIILSGMDLVVITLYLFRKQIKDHLLYRLFCLLLTIMLAGYLLDPLGEPFYDVIWVFLMPMTYLALLRRREGMVWSALLIPVIIGSALLNKDAPDGFSAEGWLKIAVIYGLVIIIHYRNERTKEMIFTIARDAHDRLKRERDRLMQAQQEIKTLNKILPICSECKRIRNDKSEWVPVDAYIPAHTNSHMSHSLCPECLSALYPDLQNTLELEVEESE